MTIDTTSQITKTKYYKLQKSNVQYEQYLNMTIIIFTAAGIGGTHCTERVKFLRNIVVNIGLG